MIECQVIWFICKRRKLIGNDKMCNAHFILLLGQRQLMAKWYQKSKYAEHIPSYLIILQGKSKVNEITYETDLNCRLIAKHLLIWAPAVPSRHHCCHLRLVLPYPVSSWGGGLVDRHDMVPSQLFKEICRSGHSHFHCLDEMFAEMMFLQLLSTAPTCPVLNVRCIVSGTAGALH